jgi:hypothetical protein
MTKLTDEELELVIAELRLDPESKATQALNKLFATYYDSLDAVEANRPIYGKWLDFAWANSGVNAPL